MSSANAGLKYMAPKEAAAHFGVSLRTIMRWVATAKIGSYQPAGPGGRILIPR